MFKIYSEKEIFEELILFKDDFPNWNKIISNHSQVYLNMSEDELLNEEIPGKPIFEFIMANAGNSPKPLKAFFDRVYHDNSTVLEESRAAFFLNYSAIEASQIQNSFGVIVHGNTEINDKVLKGSFFKVLVKNTEYANANTKGWLNLISFPLPPSNAMVISDDYLFSNEENGQAVGKPNIIQLIDAFLPPLLNVDYHITIIANDNPEKGKPAKSKTWCVNLTEQLKVAINALRPYPIVLEIVFTKTPHKRTIILNYLNSTSDKGFAVFKVIDGKTVRESNDFRCDRIFNRMELEEGDTDFKVVGEILQELKQKCLSVGQFIRNSSDNVNYRIMGDCNADFSLQNRLLKQV